MPTFQYIVTARVHRQAEDGESRMDGRPLFTNVFEDVSFSVGGDATASEIFETLRALSEGRILEVKLFEDLGSFKRSDASDPEFYNPEF